MENENNNNGNGVSDMIWGAIWCIGGIIFTTLSYDKASSGGTYVIAWGAIVFGGIQFFKGLVNSVSE